MDTYQNTESIEMSNLEQPPTRPVPTMPKKDRPSRWKNPTAVARSESEHIRPGPSSREAHGLPFSRTVRPNLHELPHTTSMMTEQIIPPNRSAHANRNELANAPPVVRQHVIPPRRQTYCLPQSTLESCLLLCAAICLLIVLAYLIAVTYHLLTKMT